MKPTQSDIMLFLDESNAIEGVFGAAALEDSYEAWEYIMEQEEITIENVLHCHKLLMARQPLTEEHKGAFRQIPVWIGGQPALHYSYIPSWMDNWVTQQNISDNFQECHVLFETIHPFVDGNGRIGRILMNWQRLKWGQPILIIHRGIEQMEYYSWFPKR